MINRLQARVRDYFGVSHREARAFLVLFVLLLVLLALPLAYRYAWPETPVDTSAADERRLDSLVALMQAGAPPTAYRESDLTTTERMSESRRGPVRRFPFDPNTISVAQWQELGLPRWLAERIDKYRSKGGRFRKKADLLRIYDFPPDLYEELEPYVTLSDSKGEAGPYGEPKSRFTPYERKPDEPTERASVAKAPYRPVAFDINTADTAQLIALKGIGAKLAGRIVKFRDALGGFATTEQYADIYGLDSLARAELLTYAKIGSAPRRIPINTASAEELDRHPFLSRRQAEVIVNYRNQHGAYTSAESLRPIRILDARTIDKLTPYLTF